MRKTLLTIVILLIVLTGCQQETSDYIGVLEVPDSAEVYLQGLVSTEDILEYPCTFSNDFTEVIFGGLTSTRERYLMQMTKTNNGWSSPERISFTGRNEMEPIFSPDGKTLIFSSDSEDKPGKPHTLYFVTKVYKEWSEAKAFPESINSDAIEYYGSMTKEGKLYFTREGSGIYYAEGADYENVNKVPLSSSYIYASHPYVSPDDTFLLFDARGSNGVGSADLYIAFRREDSYEEPINLGPHINTSDWDAMASLSPDGSVLFFVRESRGKRDIYWVKFNADDYKN